MSLKSSLLIVFLWGCFSESMAAGGDASLPLETGMSILLRSDWKNHEDAARYADEGVYGILKVKDGEMALKNAKAICEAQTLIIEKGAEEVLKVFASSGNVAVKHLQFCETVDVVRKALELHMGGGLKLMHLKDVNLFASPDRFSINKKELQENLPVIFAALNICAPFCIWINLDTFNTGKKIPTDDLFTFPLLGELRLQWAISRISSRPVISTNDLRAVFHKLKTEEIPEIIKIELGRIRGKKSKGLFNRLHGLIINSAVEVAEFRALSGCNNLSFVVIEEKTGLYFPYLCQSLRTNNQLKHVDLRELTNRNFLKDLYSDFSTARSFFGWDRRSKDRREMLEKTSTSIPSYLEPRTIRLGAVAVLLPEGVSFAKDELTAPGLYDGKDIYRNLYSSGDAASSSSVAD